MVTSYTIRTVEALATRRGEDFFPSPMEITFFEDRLEIFFPSREFSKRNICQEKYTIPYSTVMHCMYKTKSEMIEIRGDMELVRYKFDTNGNLSDKPVRCVNVKNGAMDFSIRLSDIDVISEIEAHSPLRIEAVNKYF